MVAKSILSLLAQPNQGLVNTIYNQTADQKNTGGSSVVCLSSLIEGGLVPQSPQSVEWA